MFETFVEFWNENKLRKDIGMVHHIIPGNENIELLVGPDKWRPVQEFALSYTVHKRGWLKYFPPTEFRGIRNYVTGDVEFSKLRLGFTPFRRGDDWTAVPDPDNVIVNTKGLIVTSENLTISLDGMEHSSFNAIRISED